MDVQVVDCDYKKARLTVTGKKEVRIKLNRHWSDSQKTGVANVLTKVAKVLTERNLGFTLRGNFDPDYPTLQMKSSNKRNPKIYNINVNDPIQIK